MPLEERELSRMAGRMPKPPPIPPRCPECGYNLTVATSNRCSECGRIFLASEVEQQSADARMKIMRAEGVNELMGIGVKVALVGLGLLFLGRVLGAGGGTAICLGRFGGFVCGFVAVCLGLSVTRYRQLPESIRQDVKSPPNTWLAFGSLGLGVVLVLGSLAPW